MADVQEAIEYCKKNIDTMKLRDKTDEFLCQMATRYLMADKIGRFDKNEAVYLTKFFAKYTVKIYEITGLLSEQVDISVLENEEYEKAKGKSQAICIDEGNRQEIIYSTRIVEKLMSDDPFEFLIGLQLIAHEVVHATQYSLMRKEDLENMSVTNIEQGYLMALEKVTIGRIPEFYDDNYSYLIMENNADANGLKIAMQMLRIYQPKVYELFDEKKVEETIEAYKRRSQTSDRKLKQKMFDAKDVHMIMEYITRDTLEKFPETILSKYPILKVAYRDDGTRKDIRELIQDRRRMIERGAVEDETNKLLLTILESRGTSKKEIIQQIDTIEEEIYKKRAESGFEYDL